MGIYSQSTGVSPELEAIDVNMGELMEAYFYDDFANCSDEEKKALFESAEIALLEKKNITNHKTMVRLNKNDDISRRTTMAALQLAKDNNDPLWNALKINRIKERKLLGSIEKKYNSRALKVARIGQKEYLKNVNKPKILKVSDISHRD